MEMRAFGECSRCSAVSRNSKDSLKALRQVLQGSHGDACLWPPCCLGGAASSPLASAYHRNTLRHQALLWSSPLIGGTSSSLSGCPAGSLRYRPAQEAFASNCSISTSSYQVQVCLQKVVEFTLNFFVES